MISIAWSIPSAKKQASFLSRTRSGQFNYDGKYVGATMKSIFGELDDGSIERDGYMINHARVKLGYGLRAYNKAKDLMKQWRHFQLSWAIVDNNIPVKAGEKLCVCCQELFVWIMNPLEILYVHDDRNLSQIAKVENITRSRTPFSSATIGELSSRRLFAFGSGTLKGHLLAGEERFSVEWNQEDDSVWYEIFSFSKPATWLSRATYPYIKFKQKLFASHSTDAMLKATQL